MKIGDLVRNGQGHMGIVTGLGYAGATPSYEKSPFLNPDVHVVTADGKRLWSYRALKVVSSA